MVVERSVLTEINEDVMLRYLHLQTFLALTDKCTGPELTGPQHRLANASHLCMVVVVASMLYNRRLGDP